MADFQAVLQVIDTLSDDEKRRLIKYLERYRAKPQSSAATQRVLDMHPNAAVMRDDFDAELPDTFWLDEK